MNGQDEVRPGPQLGQVPALSYENLWWLEVEAAYLSNKLSYPQPECKRGGWKPRAKNLSYEDSKGRFPKCSVHFYVYKDWG